MELPTRGVVFVNKVPNKKQSLLARKWKTMVNQEELLEGYSASIRRLKEECNDAGLSDEEFKRIYFESLAFTTSDNTRNSSRYNIAAICFVVVILFVGVVNYKIIYSCVACNVQDYIYPGLKLLRKLCIPIISLFPSLTELYHETCLIQNPFFTVVDMDCWPCSTINNVPQVFDPKPVNEHHHAPFIYETDQELIDITTLKNFYMNNRKVFDKESSKILTTKKVQVDSEEMFSKLQGNTYIWRFNNMNLAKLLRQIVKRPKVVPKFGQSTERYIVIDSSHDSFRIPDTECSYSFLMSLSGTRSVNLVPAEECKHQCKSLKIELKESYLLWYNWWYWKPIVEPSNGNSTFIGHVGSYC